MYLRIYILNLCQSLTNKSLPIYRDVIDKLTTPADYTCKYNCFLIGRMKATPEGWASVHIKNGVYNLAMETTQNYIAVCIPFLKGDTIAFGEKGFYDLATVKAG